MVSVRWVATFLSLAVTLNAVCCFTKCQRSSIIGDRYRRQTSMNYLGNMEEIDPSDPCYDFVYGDPERKVFCSPGYPNRNYTNKTECFRVLEAPPGHLIKLDFRDRFKLEDDCKNDFLEVRDGSHGYNRQIENRRFCGSEFPPIIISSDRHLWIHFHSDETVEYEGFKAVYEFIPRPNNLTTPEIIPCQINMSGEQGVLKSSEIDSNILEFNKRHGLPVDCLWNITVNVGWKIQLAIPEFHLARPNDCDSNFLDVFSNNTNTQQLKNFCGSIADTINSDTNVAFVRFFAEQRANTSNFEALFTAYRDAINNACEDDEFNCEDTTCISMSLKCNKRDNCRYRWDEITDCDTAAQPFGENHIIIIMVIFSLILSGMCFTFIFNCVKKLIRDHRTIQEYLRESREQQLNELGKQEQIERKVAKLGRSRSNSIQSSGSQRFAAVNALPNTTCYVPGGEVLPIVVRKDNGSIGDTYNQSPHYPYDNESTPQPEMCDSACQTRESLFHPYGSEHSTPNHSITSANSKPSPPAPFSTFGYKKENKFRAEAKIEVEKVEPKSKYEEKRRPYSVQTTKSAPDVIVTH